MLPPRDNAVIGAATVTGYPYCDLRIGIAAGFAADSALPAQARDRVGLAPAAPRELVR
jgi:hypothetical protein